MKQIILALALVTMGSLAAAGCGGDDDDSASNTGGTSSSTGGEPSSSNGGEPASGGASSGNVGCDPSQNGVCQNEMDCPFVVDGSARMKAQTCGQGCVISGSTDENCARDCMLKDLDMSTDCAGCYADIVKCTAEKCLGQCLNAPASAECAACQESEGCRAAFNDCSGLPPE
jgi:hypothetical protein